MQKSVVTTLKNTSVRNTKSNLFAYTFSDEKALTDLYRGMGKEIAIEDIEYLDLEKLLQRTGRYNDTAFRTKDNRIIVFVEHQFTWNKNMPYRFLEYAVDVIRILKVLGNQNRFGEKLMTYPMIEFYIAYNGKKILTEEEKLMNIDLGDIKVTAHVVDIRFDALPKETATNANDALAGYAFFAKTFEDAKKQGLSPYEAYKHAVNESIENGYLADIWSRKECVDMFIETYDYDEILKEGAREEGREEGLENGLDLSTLIFGELKKNAPLSAIAEKFGITVARVEKMKTAFAI
jgi:hypothetical protein